MELERNELEYADEGKRGSMKKKPMFVSLGVMAAVAAGTKISSSVNFAADFRAKI